MKHLKVFEKFFFSLDKLEGNLELAIFWFGNNFIKLNTNKSHSLIPGAKYEHILAKIGDDKIWKINEGKLLGVTMDNK